MSKRRKNPNYLNIAIKTKEDILIDAEDLAAIFIKESNLTNEEGKKELAEELAMLIITRRLMFIAIASGEASSEQYRVFSGTVSGARRLCKELGLAEGIVDDEPESAY